MRATAPARPPLLSARIFERHRPPHRPQVAAKRFPNLTRQRCDPRLGPRLLTTLSATFFEGRFEILGVIGQGGFSKVYRVHDDVEGEERALKLFESAAGYEAVRREIGALRKIHHPNVVEVFWAGRPAPATGISSPSSLTGSRWMSLSPERGAFATGRQ